MKRAIWIWLMCLSVIGCTWTASAASDEPLIVFVSLLPQKYFVEQIGGQRVDVQVMVEPGASPATYEPKPMQMTALSKARIYFAVGAPFESAWLEKISASNPDMRVVHTEAWIDKMPMAAHHHGGDDHDEQHDHGIRDPHIWLSPPLVMLQARHIFTALAQAVSTDREFFQVKYVKFLQTVAELDSEIRNRFAQLKGDREFMVFHPSWGYFADAYGLKQIPVELEGKDPKPADLQHLIHQAKDKNIEAVFVQPQFSARAAGIIARAIGGRVIRVDPLAENWSQNLKQIADTLAGVLER